MNSTIHVLQKLKNSLSNTRKIIQDHIMKLINNNITTDATILNAIEHQLLLSDISIHTTKKIINNIKSHIKYTNNTNHDIKLLYHTLHQEMIKIITPAEKSLCITEKTPFIMLLVGINGSGKTTTVGKLAYHYTLQNKKVILAAGDTYRSNAVNQLKIWGQRSNCMLVVTSHINADPASVIFDSIHIAKLKSADLLIIDTAGRLQNNIRSMEELKKIRKVIQKINPEAPHETILIIDANIGQNSIHQVHTFNATIKITGLIMTKLDGSAKGGTLLSIADNFTIPIRYIGIGQNIQDLQPFKSHEFIDAICTK